MVQWLGLCTSTAGGSGSIPGLGTKIQQVAWHGRRKENYLQCNTYFHNQFKFFYNLYFLPIIKEILWPAGQVSTLFTYITGTNFTKVLFK